MKGKIEQIQESTDAFSALVSYVLTNDMDVEKVDYVEISRKYHEIWFKNQGNRSEIHGSVNELQLKLETMSKGIGIVMQNLHLLTDLYIDEYENMLNITAQKTGIRIDTDLDTTEFSRHLVNLWYTKKATADILKVSRTCVHNWIKEGKLTEDIRSGYKTISRKELIRFYKRVKSQQKV